MIKLEDTTMTKRIYNQPEVQVTSIELGAVILAGSAVSSSGAGKVNTGVSTDDPW